MSLIRSYLLASLALFLSPGPSAFADDLLSGVAPASAQADLFRIKRDYTPHLYGSVEQSKILREARPYTPMQATPEMAKQSALVQTSDYANPAIPTPTFSAAVAKKATGNYLWGQSASGGYYDASGQISGQVMGDQLYRYGGKFMDGSEVPVTPVVCNFAGHVYKPYVVKRIP